MSDAPNLSYFTLAIADLDGSKRVALVSTDNRQTHNHIATAVDARALAKNILKLADFIDPPPKQWQVVEPEGEAKVRIDRAVEAAALIRTLKTGLAGKPRRAKRNVRKPRKAKR